MYNLAKEINNMNKAYEILKDISLLPGVPGQEKLVRNYIKKSN